MRKETQKVGNKAETVGHPASRVEAGEWPEIGVGK